ncbi:MAG: 5-formyltetrahydrofolate cyclo-ligase [Flavobacteriales bacterium]
MEDNILYQKAEMRKQMLAVRVSIPSDIKNGIDQLINSKLQEIIDERGVRVLHCYLPMGAEIDIKPTIQFALNKSIKVISPKTLPNRKLENRILNSLDEVEKGAWGTSHPTGKPYKGSFDLIIVPGLAFDDANYRLGYGGGYYDNFLALHPEAYKFGIFYSKQKVASVPREPHDVCLNEIISF